MELLFAWLGFSVMRLKGAWMPSEDLIKDFMKRTDAALADLHKDVRSLMEFRWKIAGMVIGSSFIFSIIFEIARAIAAGIN